jgi:hypothetical protein
LALLILGMSCTLLACNSVQNLKSSHHSATPNFDQEISVVPTQARSHLQILLMESLSEFLAAVSETDSAAMARLDAIGAAKCLSALPAFNFPSILSGLPTPTPALPVVPDGTIASKSTLVVCLG